MSKPTKKELQGILDAHRDWYGDCDLTLDHLYNVAIIRDYCPDCPGWTGHIALVVWGSSCFKDIFYYDYESDKWTLAESMNEGHYKANKEVY